jgi:HAD superfamily hydrolase (TIGR01549 family)
MFKGIILDIDNTLYPYDPVHQIALSTSLMKISQKHSIDFSQLKERYLLARDKMNKSLKDTAASHNRLLYFQHMFESLGIPPLQYALEAYNLYWDTFLENMVLFPGVIEFFHQIEGRKICLLTDLTAQIQYRKILRLGLSGFVQDIVTSEEAGFDKPHAIMFDMALEKLGLDAQDVCMVGDNYEKDILGANSMGISAYWMNWKQKEIPNMQACKSINNFYELSKALL